MITQIALPPYMVPIAERRAPTEFAGIFENVKTLGFICIFGLSLKGTFVHKQTLCGQTAGGSGCGERRGGKEQERKVRGSESGRRMFAGV